MPPRTQIDARPAELPSANVTPTTRQAPLRAAGCSSRRAACHRPARQPARARRRQRDPRHTLALQARAPESRVTLVPRTSTCGSRPRSSASTPRTTTATRPSRTPTCCTRASRRCRRISGNRTARTCGRGTKRDAPTTRCAAASSPTGRQPVRARDRRDGHRGHRAPNRGEQGDARAGARLPLRAAQRLGHQRAQPRAELRAQPADGSRRSTS